MGMYSAWRCFKYRRGDGLARTLSFLFRFPCTCCDPPDYVHLAALGFHIIMEQDINNLPMRVVITLSHAIVNDATTFLPGRQSLAPVSQIPPVIQSPPAVTPSAPVRPTSESTSVAILPSLLPSLSPSSVAITPSSSAAEPVATSTQTSTSVTIGSTSSLLNSISTVLPGSSTSTAAEIASTTSATESPESVVESISALLPTSSTPVLLTPSSALAEDTQALGQEKEQGEKAEKSPVATVPPPNNRGVAVGIAFGAFGKSFSLRVSQPFTYRKCSWILNRYSWCCSYL